MIDFPIIAREILVSSKTPEARTQAITEKMVNPVAREAFKVWAQDHQSFIDKSPIMQQFKGKVEEIEAQTSWFSLPSRIYKVALTWYNVDTQKALEEAVLNHPEALESLLKENMASLPFNLSLLLEYVDVGILDEKIFSFLNEETFLEKLTPSIYSTTLIANADLIEKLENTHPGLVAKILSLEDLLHVESPASERATETRAESGTIENEMTESEMSEAGIEKIEAPDISNKDLQDISNKHAQDLRRMTAKPGIGLKVYGGLNTLLAMITSKLFGGLQFTPHPDPQILAAQKRVADPGQMLAASDVIAFTDSIKMMTPLKTINTFYSNENKSINSYSLEEIIKIINKSKESYQPPTPICIPVTITNNGAFDRTHIVLITIKDGIVEYYDSKGVGSDSHKLADDGKSLRDVVEYCKKAFEAHEILEHPFQQQFDANNCGVFVCRQIYKRFIEMEPAGSISNSPPSPRELNNFRSFIISHAYPLPSAEVEETLKGKGINITPIVEDGISLSKQFVKDLPRLGSLTIGPKIYSQEINEPPSKVYIELKAYAKESLNEHPTIKRLLTQNPGLTEDLIVDMFVQRLTRLVTQGVLGDMTGTLIKKYDDYYVENVAAADQKQIIENLRKTKKEEDPPVMAISAIGGAQHVSIEIIGNEVKFKNTSKFKFNAFQYHENEVVDIFSLGEVVATRTVTGLVSKLLLPDFEEKGSDMGDVKVVDWFSSLKK